MVRLIKEWIGNRVPEYVFKETIYNSVRHIDHILKRDWQLEVLEIGLDDFCSDTRRRILERSFGDVEFPGTDRDLERTALQREKAIAEEPGTNEPVIIEEGIDGWELLEGWHRTMARLPRDGSKTKLRAWIGRRKHI